MIKCVITWHGIDKTGSRVNSHFVGSYRRLLAHLKTQNIILVSKKIEFSLATQQNHFQIFISDLADLLQTGLHLITAIILLQKKYQDSLLKARIQNLLKLLQAGNTLAYALATHFNCSQKKVDLELIGIAERTHKLSHTLSQLVTQFQIQHNIHKQLHKAMIYPCCVLLFTFFITLGLLTFVIPQFQSMFDNFNATLPLPTRIALSISHVLIKHGISLNLLFTFLVFLSLRLKSIRNLFFKKLKRMKIIYHWSSVCASCLDSGLTVTKSFTLANRTISDTKLQKVMRHAINHIKSGQTCAQALSHTKLLDHSQLYLIDIGASSATLNTMLKRIAQQTADQLQQRLENLSKWLEPVIMLILAIIVGGLIITMYLPIFNLGSLL